MEDKLVSVVSPCYNKSVALRRFLDSIIIQDYRPIELIIVNDGSTDDSYDVLQAYIQKMEDNDIEYVIVNQENAGVGAATQTGLQYVHGEFICWPDCDDWFSKTAISDRVKFLQENKAYASVTCNANIFSENDLQTPIGKMIRGDDDDSNPDQFQLMLNGKSTFCPGCHLVRTNCLFEVLNERSIFPSRYGQNLQLLLPLYYKYKRGFIDKALYNYVVYSNSLSHSAKSFEELLNMRKGRYKLKIETINRLKGASDTEKKAYNRTITINEIRYRLDIAYNFAEYEYARRLLYKLKRIGGLRLRDTVEFRKNSLRYLMQKQYRTLKALV